MVYVEPRDARLEWANGVSRWFRLFRWIGMMGSDKQCVRLPRHPVKHKRLARWLPSFAKCCPLPQVSRTSTGCFFTCSQEWVLRLRVQINWFPQFLIETKLSKLSKCRNALPIYHQHTMVTPLLLLKGWKDSESVIINTNI